MIEEIRKIVNYDSYENKTKRLLELREEVLKSSSVKRFFKLRKIVIGNYGIYVQIEKI